MIETTIQNAHDRWPQVFIAEIMVNGSRRTVEHIRQDQYGFIVRTPYHSRFDKGTTYVDRRVYPKTCCWVEWEKKDVRPAPTPRT